MPRKASTVVVYDSFLEQVHAGNTKSPEFSDNVEVIRGDVRDGEALSNCLRTASPRLIYHLAAETGTGQSYDEPSRYCDVNVMGTARLVEAIRECAPDAERVVLSSSRAVYGEGPYETPDGRIVVPPARRPECLADGRFDPEHASGAPLTPRRATSATPPAPASIYASTKLMQELILRQGLEGTGTGLATVRIQNAYGPGQSLRNPYTGVLSVFASQILADQRLNIFEDGNIVRDFVFVDDVVRALHYAGVVPVAPASPIDVGSGQSVTILQVAQEMLRILGRSQHELSISGDYRTGDVRHAVADIREAKLALNWEPEVALSEGLERLVRWASGTRELAPVSARYDQ